MKDIKKITRSHWFTSLCMTIMFAAGLYGIYTLDVSPWVKLGWNIVLMLCASQAIGNYREAIGRRR